MINKDYFVFPRVYMLFQLLTRICLTGYAIFHKQIEFLQIPGIFFAGMINDLVSMIYALPWVVSITALFMWLFKKIKIPSFPAALAGYFFLLITMIFNLLAEVSFWDEFSTRYNFIAVDYLIYTQEIIGTVLESMPVIPLIGGMVAVAGIATALSISYIRNILSQVDNKIVIKTIVASLIISVITFKFYDSNKLKLSDNIYAQELGKNGPYEFFSAFRNNSLNYMQFYPSIDEDKALKIVRASVLQPNQKFVSDEGVERETRQNISIVTPGLTQDLKKPDEIPALGRNDYYNKPNIILITIESLSAEYMSTFGNTHNITPNMDRIAEESVFFTKLYAAGTRTVRGLEALSLGVPPTPGSSIIRRVDNHDLFNIGTPLKAQGYDLMFLFGGMSYFDNLDDYFSGNGYRVIDRTSLSSDEITFSNVWGVADEDLFGRAIKEIDQSYAAGKPFFSFVMTTNNHRPYTYPEGKIDIPSGTGRHGAVKYTDYTIGKFIEDARKKPWFDNTIFIITADHCASSAGKTHLPVNKYHIPLMIYAPKLLKAQKIESLTSQIDISPTILGLLDIDYKSKFMGKDVLNYPSNRAFIGTYQMLGFMKNDHLVILSPKSPAKVYSLKGSEQIEVEGMEHLIEESISFYQVAYLNFVSGKMKE